MFAFHPPWTTDMARITEKCFANACASPKEGNNNLQRVFGVSEAKSASQGSPMGNLFLHSSSPITGYGTQKMASVDQRGATAASNGERGQGDLAPLCALPAGDVKKTKGSTTGPRPEAEGPRLGAEGPKTSKRARRGLVALGVDPADKDPWGTKEVPTTATAMASAMAPSFHPTHTYHMGMPPPKMPFLSAGGVGAGFDMDDINRTAPSRPPCPTPMEQAPSRRSAYPQHGRGGVLGFPILQPPASLEESMRRLRERSELMLKMRLPSLSQILGQGNPKHFVEVLPTQNSLADHPVPMAPWGGVGSPPSSNWMDLAHGDGQNFLPPFGQARNLPNSQGIAEGNIEASKMLGVVGKAASFQVNLGEENCVSPKPLVQFAEIDLVSNEESSAHSSSHVDPPGGSMVGNGAKMDILADKGQKMEAEKCCSLGQMGVDPPTAQVTSEGTIHAPKVNFGDNLLQEGVFVQSPHGMKPQSAAEMVRNYVEKTGAKIPSLTSTSGDAPRMLLDEYRSGPLDGSPHLGGQSAGMFGNTFLLSFSGPGGESLANFPVEVQKCPSPGEGGGHISPTSSSHLGEPPQQGFVDLDKVPLDKYFVENPFDAFMAFSSPPRGG